MTGASALVKSFECTESVDPSRDWEVGRVVVLAMVGLSVSVSADSTLRGARIGYERVYFILVWLARAAGRLLVCGGGIWGPATRWGPAYLREDMRIITCVTLSCFAHCWVSKVPVGSFFDHINRTNIPKYTLTVREDTGSGRPDHFSLSYTH